MFIRNREPAGTVIGAERVLSRCTDDSPMGTGTSKLAQNTAFRNASLAHPMSTLITHRMLVGRTNNLTLNDVIV